MANVVESYIDVPEMLVMSPRVHNKLVKSAVRTVMEDHWKQTIPKHFQADAHARYGYAQRNRKYISQKIRKYGGRSGFDLIKTGRTKDRMTSIMKLQVGGRGDKGTIVATLQLKFGWSNKSTRGKQYTSRRLNRNRKMIPVEPVQHKASITPAMMAMEIARVLPGEYYLMQKRLKENYVSEMLRTTSMRQRIKP